LALRSGQAVGDSLAVGAQIMATAVLRLTLPLLSMPIRTLTMFHGPQPANYHPRSLHRSAFIHMMPETHIAHPSLANVDELKALKDPLVLDVRDPEEVEKCKGGEPIAGSINLPLNVDGAPQSTYLTSASELSAKLESAGLSNLDKERPVVTHCSRGGRGSKAAALLQQLGFVNAVNGGSADRIRAARGG